MSKIKMERPFKSLSLTGLAGLLTVLSGLLVLMICLTGCDDAENEFDERYARPSVILEEFSPGPSPYGNKVPDRIYYPKSVLIYDTVILAGRFHLGKGGTITLGKAKAELIYTWKRRLQIDATNYDSIDIVEFIVTAAMGEGPQPLLLEANGIRQYAPNITILTKPALELKTDTTLYLQELFNETIPGFTGRYFSQNTEDFFAGKCVTGDGTIYLQASLDVYRFDGTFQNILKAPDIIDVEGEAVTIRSFLGMAVNRENTKMYLSIEAKIPPVDGYTTATLLVEKDLTTGEYILLNKTLPSTEARDEGDLKQMAVTAYDLKVDAKGRLLFQADLLNGFYIKRMDEAGRVKVVLNAGNSALGFRIKGFYSYTQDGLEAYVGHESNGIMRYDLENGVPLAQINGGQQLSLVSTESKSDYTFKDDWRVFTTYPTSYMALPDGILLDIFGQTIGAIVMDKYSIFAFAGLERGYSFFPSDFPIVQNQTKGQARYVNFGYAENTGKSRFLGTDAEGTIYLIGGGGKSNGKTLPPRLYKLVKP